MRDAKVQSQSQLARASGVPQPTINRILKGGGKQGPETSTLMALAVALSVEVRWLQTGEGPKRIARQDDESEPKAPRAAGHLRAVEQEVANILQWMTPREAELFSIFRSHAEAQQERLLVMARALPGAIIKKRDREEDATRPPDVAGNF